MARQSDERALPRTLMGMPVIVVNHIPPSPPAPITYGNWSGYVLSDEEAEQLARFRAMLDRTVELAGQIGTED